jgi:hypothetical protein
MSAHVRTSRFTCQIISFTVLRSPDTRVHSLQDKKSVRIDLKVFGARAATAVLAAVILVLGTATAGPSSVVQYNAVQTRASGLDFTVTLQNPLLGEFIELK